MDNERRELKNSKQIYKINIEDKGGQFFSKEIRVFEDQDKRFKAIKCVETNSKKTVLAVFEKYLSKEHKLMLEISKKLKTLSMTRRRKFILEPKEEVLTAKLGEEFYLKGFILPYMPHNLTLYLKNKLDEIHLIRLMDEILSILVALKRFNFCHRDIKPENIFLDKLKRVRLGDFGESKEIKALVMNKLYDEYNNRELNTCVGTRGYMAPEIITSIEKNRFTDCDPFKTDLFSLGVTFFKLKSKDHSKILFHLSASDPSCYDTVIKILDDKSNVKASSEFREGLRTMLKKENRLDLEEFYKDYFQLHLYPKLKSNYEEMVRSPLDTVKFSRQSEENFFDIYELSLIERRENHVILYNGIPVDIICVLKDYKFEDRLFNLVFEELNVSYNQLFYSPKMIPSGLLRFVASELSNSNIKLLIEKPHTSQSLADIFKSQTLLNYFPEEHDHIQVRIGLLKQLLYLYKHIKENSEIVLIDLNAYNLTIQEGKLMIKNYGIDFSIWKVLKELQLVSKYIPNEFNNKDYFTKHPEHPNYDSLKSDLWNLGVVIFQLFSDKPLPTGNSIPTELIYMYTPESVVELIKGLVTNKPNERIEIASVYEKFGISWN